MSEIPLAARQATEGQSSVSHHARTAGWVLGGIALAWFLGAILDVAVLWFAQRQDSVNWEFVAISNTISAMPRLSIPLALVFVAMVLSGATSTAIYRIIGLVLLLEGIVVLALTALFVTDYVAIRDAVSASGQRALGMVTSAVAQTLLTGLIYAVILSFVGWKSLRRPG